MSPTSDAWRPAEGTKSTSRRNTSSVSACGLLSNNNNFVLLFIAAILWDVECILAVIGTGGP
eukprot:6050573-Pyramimonas_sp.AAC.1